jgi:hypothetical protein
VVQAFNDWMNGGGALWLAAGSALACVAAPLLVLVHELGHAVVGLVRTEGLVGVRVGRTPARWRFRVGRLHLELSLHPARNAPAGVAAIHARFGVGTKVALALAGPLAEASAATLIVALALRAHLVVLVVVGAAGILDALANLIPLERHGLRSDGGYMIDALRSARDRRPTAPSGRVEDFVQRLADTQSRWFVVYTDERSPIRTEERAQLLGGATRALGHTDPSDPAVLAIWWLAFAGWCWREVERGNPARTRDAALDALHAARVTGVVEPELSIRAALTLASGATPLGLASPGSDAEESIRFLAGAFWKMPIALRSAIVSEEQQKSAFRYGVALRDVERARD